MESARRLLWNGEGPWRVLHGVRHELGRSGTGHRRAQTAAEFDKPEYRFLVVANKFQTGFDQPLLHTMYVDKKLGGVNAVQTLSRLNRTHPGKKGAMVLDFANEAEEIRKAFEPYYETTLLSEETDPNLLYEFQGRLLNFGVFMSDDVETFGRVYFDPKSTQDRLYAALEPARQRFVELAPAKGATSAASSPTTYACTSSSLRC